VTLNVRAVADPDKLQAGLRNLVHGLDPKLAVSSTATLVGQRDSEISRERLLAFPSDFLGCLAGALVAIGLYGLVAYAVVQRTGEIGIRLALGARPGDIRWLFVRESLAVSAMGVAVGLPMAWMSSRVLKTIVFGVSAHDSWALIVGSVALLAISAAAALVPSWRGSRLDPMRALRYE
jgi:ABC-type antimicrobial peptide transport system permease subunit